MKCPLPSYSTSKVAAVKLNETHILFDAGRVAESEDFKKAHEAVKNAVNDMSWPPGSTKGLIIPRIVSIKRGDPYTDIKG